MFEPGKKYMFSRTAFWNDSIKKTSGVLPENLWWIKELDGHVFIGLGGTIQTIVKGGFQFKVISEWCIEAEAELL